jgi:hypothetical protein
MAKEIKIATFNVEWMVNLFEKDRPELLARPARGNQFGSRPKDPLACAARIAKVIEALDADVLGICEGPPMRAQMQAFNERFLANAYDVFSMEDGPQSVHTLVHKRLVAEIGVSQLPRHDKVYQRLDQARP